MDEHRARARRVEVVEGGEVVRGQAASWRRLVEISEEELAHEALLGIGRRAKHDAQLRIEAVEEGGLIRWVGRGVWRVREGDVLRPDVAVVEGEQVAHLRYAGLQAGYTGLQAVEREQLAQLVDCRIG